MTWQWRWCGTTDIRWRWWSLKKYEGMGIIALMREISDIERMGVLMRKCMKGLEWCTDERHFIEPNPLCGGSKSQKTSFLGHFGLIWAHLAQFGHNEIFFEKSGSVTFLPLWSPNLMQKIRTIPWLHSEINVLRTVRLTDWLTDGAHFIGPPLRGSNNLNCTIILNS